MEFQSSASSPIDVIFRKNLMDNICVFLICFSMFWMFYILTMYIMLLWTHFEGYLVDFQSSVTSQ